MALVARDGASAGVAPGALLLGGSGANIGAPGEVIQRAMVAAAAKQRALQNTSVDLARRTVDELVQDHCEKSKTEHPKAHMESILFISRCATPDERSRHYVISTAKRTEQKAKQRDSARCDPHATCLICKRKMLVEYDSCEEMCPGHASVVAFHDHIVHPDPERMRAFVSLLTFIGKPHAKTGRRAVCPFCIIANEELERNIALLEEKTANLADAASPPSSPGPMDAAAAAAAATSAAAVHTVVPGLRPPYAKCEWCSSGALIVKFIDAKVTSVMSDSAAAAAAAAAQSVRDAEEMTESGCRAEKPQKHASQLSGERKTGYALFEVTLRIIYAATNAADAAPHSEDAMAIADDGDDDGGSGQHQRQTEPSTRSSSSASSKHGIVKKVFVDAPSVELLCSGICRPWCAKLRAALDSEHMPRSAEDFIADCALILPERLRPVYITKKNEPIVSDFTKHAARIAFGVVHRASDQVQHSLGEYIGSEKQLTRQGIKPLETISDALSRKNGALRKTMQGKRLNYTARLVISGSHSTPLGVLEVPRAVADKVIVREPVTAQNAELMMLMLRDPVSGENVSRVRRQNGNGGYELLYFRGTKGAEKRRHELVLRIGDVIERGLRDGDYVLFNRQPTLHRLSMLGFTVKIGRSYVLKFNQAQTGPFNADFDGDEMNIHVPQYPAARVEISILAHASKKALSPSSGASVISAIQDTIIGAYLLTRCAGGGLFAQRQVFDLAVAAGIFGPASSTSTDNEPMKTIPAAYLCHSKATIAACSRYCLAGESVTGSDRRVEMWSGSQVASLAMYKIRETAGNNTPADEKFKKTSPSPSSSSSSSTSNGHAQRLVTYDTIDFSALVRAYRAYDGSAQTADASFDEVCNATATSRDHGRWKPTQRGIVAIGSQFALGAVTSDDIGKGKPGSMLTALMKEDPGAGIAFVGRLQRVAVEWLMCRGFSIGLGDLHVDTSVRAAALSELDAVGSRKSLAELDALVSVLPVQKRREKFEVLLCDRYGSACRRSEDAVRSMISADNSLAIMCISGSKGSWSSTTSSLTNVGIQYEGGAPMPKSLYGRRISTSVVRAMNDTDPESNAVVETSYCDGLTPLGMMLHASGARGGLTQTALGTAKTGAASRDQVKIEEAIKVDDWGSAVDADGRIVQLAYGCDNLDGMRVVEVRIETFQGVPPAIVAIGKCSSLDPRSLSKLTASSDGNGEEAAVSMAMEAVGLGNCCGSAARRQIASLAECAKWAERAPVSATSRVFCGGKQKKHAVPANCATILEDIIPLFGNRNGGGKVDGFSGTPPMADAEKYATADELLDAVDTIVRAVRDCYGHTLACKIEWAMAPDAKKSDPVFRDTWAPYIALPYIAHIRETLVAVDLGARKATIGDMNRLRKEIVRETMRAFCPTGEMVGIICAQSISETLMQLALNMFHQAGSLSTIVTSGLLRVVEILNLTHNQKTPLVRVLVRNKLIPVLKDAESGSKTLSVAGAISLDSKLKYALVARYLGSVVDSAIVDGESSPPRKKWKEPTRGTHDCANGASSAAAEESFSEQMTSYNMFPEHPPAGAVLSRAVMYISVPARIVRGCCPDGSYRTFLEAIETALVRNVWAASTSTAIQPAGRVHPGKRRIAKIAIGSSARAPDIVRKAVAAAASASSASTSSSSSSSSSGTSKACGRSVPWVRVAHDFESHLAKGSYAIALRMAIDCGAADGDEKAAPEDRASEAIDEGRDAAEEFCCMCLREAVSPKRLATTLVCGSAGITDVEYSGIHEGCLEGNWADVAICGQPGTILTSLAASPEAGKLLDLDTLTSNDIREIASVYGIEAARSAIANEMASVHGASTRVSSRHMYLISDVMTYSGKPSPLSAGHSKDSRSAISRMTHESPRQVADRAAMTKEICYPVDPSAAIFFGTSHARLGTGMSDALFDPNLAPSDGSAAAAAAPQNGPPAQSSRPAPTSAIERASMALERQKSLVGALDAARSEISRRLVFPCKHMLRICSYVPKVSVTSRRSQAPWGGVSPSSHSTSTPDSTRSRTREQNTRKRHDSGDRSDTYRPCKSQRRSDNIHPSRESHYHSAQTDAAGIREKWYPSAAQNDIPDWLKDGSQQSAAADTDMPPSGSCGEYDPEHPGCGIYANTGSCHVPRTSVLPDEYDPQTPGYAPPSPSYQPSSPAYNPLSPEIRANVAAAQIVCTPPPHPTAAAAAAAAAIDQSDRYSPSCDLGDLEDDRNSPAYCPSTPAYVPDDINDTMVGGNPVLDAGEKQQHVSPPASPSREQTDPRSSPQIDAQEYDKSDRPIEDDIESHEADEAPLEPHATDVLGDRTSDSAQPPVEASETEGHDNPVEPHRSLSPSKPVNVDVSVVEPENAVAGGVSDAATGVVSQEKEHEDGELSDVDESSIPKRVDTPTSVHSSPARSPSPSPSPSRSRSPSVAPDKTPTREATPPARQSRSRTRSRSRSRSQSGSRSPKSSRSRSRSRSQTQSRPTSPREQEKSAGAKTSSRSRSRSVTRPKSRSLSKSSTSSSSSSSSVARSRSPSVERTSSPVVVSQPRGRRASRSESRSASRSATRSSRSRSKSPPEDKQDEPSATPLPLPPSPARARSSSRGSSVSRSRTPPRLRTRTKLREERRSRSKTRSKSKSGSRSRSRSKTGSRSRSRSKTKSRSRSKTGSRSRSRSKTKSRSRSRSRSRSAHKTKRTHQHDSRSRSRTKTRSRTRGHVKARSRSPERTIRRKDDAAPRRPVSGFGQQPWRGRIASGSGMSHGMTQRYPQPWPRVWQNRGRFDHRPGQAQFDGQADMQRGNGWRGRGGFQTRRGRPDHGAAPFDYRHEHDRAPRGRNPMQPANAHSHGEQQPANAQSHDEQQPVVDQVPPFHPVPRSQYDSLHDSKVPSKKRPASRSPTRPCASDEKKKKFKPGQDTAKQAQVQARVPPVRRPSENRANLCDKPAGPQGHVESTVRIPRNQTPGAVKQMPGKIVVSLTGNKREVSARQ